MSVPHELARSFQVIARRLDSAALHCVGFTGAVTGEGASTIALGTALALASLQRDTVLLVDANWIEPTLTNDAHLESAPGLAECLAKKAAFAAVVRPTIRSRLAFVPIGDRSVATPGPRSLATFVAVHASCYRSVVVDLPPVLGSERFVMPWAALLDQLFVVVREAATPLPLVRQALGRIETVGPSAHIVLNRTMAGTAEVATALPAARP